MLFRGEYWFLSNFYPCEIVSKDGMYTAHSVEQAYQASKCALQSEFELIMNCTTPAKAKSLGGKVHMKENFDRLAIMESLLRKKFSVPELKRMLLETGSIELIEENSWHDRFWGTCQGKGHNHLGKLIMKIRNELRST